MLQAFIITLREGVEAALIVGITLAYLAKIGRGDLRKAVYAALGAAFLGSIGVAVVISRLNWNEDVFEGWIMLAAAFFVVTMVIFMMKTGRKLKGEIEGKVGLLAGEDAWIGLFFFVFLMVLREGVETVLILSAVSLNSTGLMSFLGTRDCIRRDVRQRQRADQPAEVLPGHDRYFVSGGGAVGGGRLARTVGERRDRLVQARDGDHWTDRAQRSFLLRHDFRPGRANGVV